MALSSVLCFSAFLASRRTRRCEIRIHTRSTRRKIKNPPKRTPRPIRRYQEMSCLEDPAGQFVSGGHSLGSLLCFSQ